MAQRIGTAFMTKASVSLVVRGYGSSVIVSNGSSSLAEMSVAEAKMWREGLSRAIREAEAYRADPNAAPAP